MKATMLISVKYFKLPSDLFTVIVSNEIRQLSYLLTETG